MSKQHVSRLINIGKGDEASDVQCAEQIRSAVREGDVELGDELASVLHYYTEDFGLEARNALAQSLTFQTRARRMVGLAMEQIEKWNDEQLQAAYDGNDGFRDWVNGTVVAGFDISYVIDIVVACGRDPAYGLLYVVGMSATATDASDTLEDAVIHNDTERGIEWRKRMKSRLQPSRSS